MPYPGWPAGGKNGNRRFHFPTFQFSTFLQPAEPEMVPSIKMSQIELPRAKGKKRALLVEGGGMKGAFSGGALHALHTFRSSEQYDLILAVSSGACSAASKLHAPISKLNAPRYQCQISKLDFQDTIFKSRIPTFLVLSLKTCIPVVNHHMSNLKL